MSLGETILQLYMFIFALTWFYRLPPDDEHGTGSTKLDHRQVPDIDRLLWLTENPLLWLASFKVFLLA